MSILEKMDDPELMVRENDAGELEFRGKRKAFGVTKDAEIFLPVDRVEKPKKWEALSKDFTEAVGLVQHCVSKDESKFSLTCIHLHPQHVEACDNYQILRCKVKTGIGDEPILVRGSSLSPIVNLAMDRICITPKWMHFRNQDGLIYSCRRYAEDYPTLDKQIGFKGHHITIPKGLAEASDRAAIFAFDKTGEALVEVSIKDDKIRIIGRGLSGWFKEIKSIKYSGPPMEFNIAPELLKHVSEKYTDAQITDGRLKVTGGSWEYVTVLGQPKAEEEEEEQEDGDKDEEDKE
jgi:DNA polymerase III sliding clamp (beta) subunit (PCNA family)